MGGVTPWAPNTQYTIPNTQYPVHNTQYPIPPYGYSLVRSGNAGSSALLSISRVPSLMPDRSIVPAGSSITTHDFSIGPNIRQGLRLGARWITSPASLRKMTSIANRINRVWMPLHGAIQSPEPLSSDLLPIRPTDRFHTVSATSILGAALHARSRFQRFRRTIAMPNDSPEA